MCDARAPIRIRTEDPFITNEVLYQLSYWGYAKRRLNAPLAIVQWPQNGASLGLLGGAFGFTSAGEFTSGIIDCGTCSPSSIACRMIFVRRSLSRAGGLVAELKREV